MKNWSIRWRLTVSNALVLVSLFAVFCGVMLVLVHGHLQHEEDEWLSEELRELGQDVRLSRDATHLQETFEQRYAVHSDVHFRVAFEPGVPLIQSRYLGGTSLPWPSTADRAEQPVFENVDLPGIGQLRLLSLTVGDSRDQPVFLQVASPRSAMGEEFRWYVGTVLAAVPIAFVVAIVAGYVLARQALAPVDQMVATAERISAERLEERLSVKNPSDELGRLALTLNATFDRLHRLIEQIRRFTADAAHELRSPIAAIRTEAEVTLRAPREAEVYRQALERTAEGSAMLAELVHQLLTLSRYDAGQLPVLEDSVRVDLLILDVVERIRGRAQDAGLQLVCESLPPWLARGDDLLLGQLFYNILDNALKYTPAGGTVQIRARVDRQDIVVEVEDTGIGIPTDVRHRIFDRFFRVDPSNNGERGGAGLGLAICRAICEMHGGRIEVTSTPGAGSCFQVFLPGQLDREPVSIDENSKPHSNDTAK